ncbi:hypothetical protein [Longirhabdus pacifica]|uniref:hypothetical protein n=1 Tax=Longirhabdus pacifica TaxID=2305227 RepID=UPI001008CE9C|nr:hypothetical protein [Longirhabdus pacifica]
MPEKTTRFEIIKSLEEDKISRALFNENWNIIDNAVTSTADYNTHVQSDIHITEVERSAWNDKETIVGAQNKANRVIIDSNDYTSNSVSNVIKSEADDIVVNPQNNYGKIELEEALQAHFLTAHQGKQSIADAINDVDVVNKNADPNDSFLQLSTKITRIRKFFSTRKLEEYSYEYAPTDTVFVTLHPHTGYTQMVVLCHDRYACINNTGLYVIDANGNVQGSKTLNKPISVTKDSDGYLYVFEQGTRILYQFDQQLIQQWAILFSSSDVYAVAHDNQKGYLYIAGNDIIEKIAQLDGGTIWTYALDDVFKGQVVDMDTDGMDNVYVVVVDNTNTQLGKVKTDGNDNPELEWFQDDSFAKGSSIVVDGEKGYFYYGNENGALYKKDLNNQEQWVRSYAGAIRSIQVSKDQYVTFVNNVQNVYKLNAEGEQIYVHVYNTPDPGSILSLYLDDESYVHTLHHNKIVKTSGMYRFLA